MKFIEISNEFHVKTLSKFSEVNNEKQFDVSLKGFGGF